MTDPITFDRDGKPGEVWKHVGRIYERATPDDLRAAGWVPATEIERTAPNWKKRCHEAEVELSQLKEQLAKVRDECHKEWWKAQDEIDELKEQLLAERYDQTHRDDCFGAL